MLESVVSLVLMALLLVAVLVFARIQAELNDPGRKERNEAWFARFEAHLRERYRDPALHWRLRALEAHFRNRVAG